VLANFSGITGADYIRQAVSRDELAAHPVDQVSQLEIHCYLMNTLLRDLDTFSMAHSLEVRVPLLDHRLLELMAQVPGAEKIDRRTNKHLLVKTAGNRLPREVSKRPKGLFWFPWNQWLRRHLRPGVESVLRGKASQPDRVGLRAGVVQDLWRRFLEEDASVHWLHVWTLYVLLRWSEERGVSL
jgi:asparagine synthase (glutamine-hydrolysing)